MMEITGRSALLAMLADPVAQARAPGLVNAALASRGCDAVLVPLRVPSEALERVVTALRAIGNFKGAVVSMPHKSRMLALVDEATPQAREVGACNVIRREADGRLVATMYDGEGFVAGLRRAGHEVAGRRAFLAGAGGAASAIAFALGKFGAAALTIHNRTGAKAQALAARVQRAWPRLAVAVGEEDARGHDLVINGTSLGMREGTHCRSTRARSTAAPSPRRSSSPTRRRRFSRWPESVAAPSTSASRCLKCRST